MALIFIIRPLITALYGRNFKPKIFIDITRSAKLFVAQILVSKHKF